MTKRLAYYGFAILAAGGLVFATAAAQQGNSGQNTSQYGMMQGGMGSMYSRGGMNYGYGGIGGMRGVMMYGLRNPAGRSTMMPFLLPEMKSELGLSQSRTSSLHALKQQFTDEEQKTSGQIATARRDLNAQFSSGKPDQSQVGKDVNEIANLQAQRLLNSYETAAKIKATLTPEQRSRLGAMKPAGLYNSMMSHMTVNQMEQMMRYMYGSGGAAMMSGGMMGNGMMGGGTMGTMMGGMYGQGTPQKP
jgi:Spy/CpxP family protein refolding chaperone